MRRKELQEIIDREFDSFIDFPGDLRKAVTVASCKLFAEHVVGVIQTRPAVQRDVAGLVEALEEIAQSRDSGRHDGLPEDGPALSDVEAWLVANDALAAYRREAKT